MPKVKFSVIFVLDNRLHINIYGKSEGNSLYKNRSTLFIIACVTREELYNNIPSIEKTRIFGIIIYSLDICVCIIFKRYHLIIHMKKGD